MFYINKLTISLLIYFYLPFLNLQKFINLTSLSFDECQHLSLIPDVSSLTQLEIFSFRLCHELSTIHNFIGFMKKLKILNAHGCRNLKAFPPIRLTSLE